VCVCVSVSQRPPAGVLIGTNCCQLACQARTAKFVSDRKKGKHCCTCALMKHSNGTASLTTGLTQAVAAAGIGL